MDRGTLEYLLYFIPSISLLGCFVGLYFYRRLSGEGKLVFFYLLTCLIFDVLGRVLEHTHNNNLILIPAFGFLELLIFSLIYHRYLITRKPILLVVNILALGFILTDFVLVDPFKLSDFHSVGRIVDGFLILMLCLAFFFDLLKDETHSSRPNRRFNVATFLFFTVNSLWFLVVNFLINAMGESIYYVWLINIIATPLFYLYLTFYLWKNRTVRIY